MSPTGCPGDWRAPTVRTAPRADHTLRAFVSFLLLFLLAFLTAGRATADGRTTVKLSEVESGALLMRTKEAGKFKRLPTVKTHVEMEISGLVARVRVSQAFTNPSKQWIEGVYVFPLPTNSAVDRLRLRVGDRFLEGKIKERALARKIYLEALKAGRKAALTEQERPNIFTNSVANIGPGETVLVQIEYQQTLRYDRGAFSLRFPMVVGPRYIPSGEKTVAFAGTGWGRNTRTVPDASRITPRVLHPRHGKINPVSLKITLKPGFPLAWVKSGTHKLKITENADGSRSIKFDDKAVFAERDFVLRWLPKTGAAPGAGLFTETVNGKTYALVMVMPPHKQTNAIKRLPREAIFIIDTSGSMSGASIAQAKAALLLALDRLKPGDRFNVIEFNSQARALYPSAMRVDRGTIANAKRFVSVLAARGGTNMAAALNLALNRSRDDSRLRQVIFLTDGSVGNETQLFRLIRNRLGDTRLFTVGIGSAPNSYFMSKAAQYGRGTFTYISRVADVKTRMTALFRKIEEPVLTDIRVRFPRATQAEAWPKKPADLYRGEPVIVAVELKKLKGKVTIEGRFAGRPWKLALPLTGGQAGKGISALWARAKIAALMDRLHEGANRKEVEAAVVKVALAHHLVSKFTSLVAVDVTPARPKGVAVATRAVPVNLPTGWNFEAVFGPQNKRQRKGEDRARKASAPADPGPIGVDAEKRQRSMATGAKRYSKLSNAPAMSPKVKPRTIGPKTSSSARPAKPADRMAREAAARAGQQPKKQVRVDAKPVQTADASGRKAVSPVKAPNKAGTVEIGRDFYVAFGLFVLLLAGVMGWLRRSRLA